MTHQPTGRALCIGISTFGSTEGEPATDVPGDLPYAVDRAVDVQDALVRLGYECSTVDARELDSADALGAVVKGRLISARAGAVEVVHVLTRGVLKDSGLYLLGADGKHSPDTDVAHWVATVESFDDRPTTLFLLDACHAGDAARLSWLPAARDGAKAWVIAATTRHDPAYDGVFSLAVAQVLTEIADGTLDVYPSQYVPFGVLVEQIRLRAAAIGVRGQEVTSTPVDGAPEPPFVPNPRQPAGPVAALVAQSSDEVLRPFLDLDVSLDAAHFADRAAGRPLGYGLQQGVFTGRRQLLRELTRWLVGGREALWVVTGGAGSGKSAVLGILICATHRDLRPVTAGLRDAVPEEDLPPIIEALAGIHLRERDLSAVVAGLRRQLALPIGPADASGPEDENHNTSPTSTSADTTDSAEPSTSTGTPPDLPGRHYRQAQSSTSTSTQPDLHGWNIRHPHDRIRRKRLLGGLIHEYETAA
ncbi:hypothetical protein ABH935_008608 [Catenulispora sp. GAS73]|uniref:hypothetical protein n=1 Tax=Catenulispora sp. GAS73 TaxID=3156269 RepID=UPI0035176301